MELRQSVVSDRHVLEKQAIRSRLTSAICITCIGFFLPLVFWQTSLAKFPLILWGLAQIPIGLTLLAAMQARKRGQNRAARNWNLATLVGWSLCFAILPWLEPAASGLTPDKYMLFCAMLAVTGIISVSAAQLPHANRLRTFLFLTVAASYATAYAINDEPAIATIALMWFLAIYFNTEVNVKAALELKELRKSSEHDATHDSLSTLYNRHGFISSVQTNLTRHGKDSLAVFDLNDFKSINDALGHQFGDHVLSTIGHRLKQSLPKDSICARIGGDEFAAIIPAREQTHVHRILQNTLATLSEPIEFQTYAKRVHASVGVATFKTGLSLSDWMAEADAAMYCSKKNPHCDISYSDHHTRRETAERLKLEDRFRAAIAKGEITFWCQPIVAADTHRPVGVELLARWPQPNGTTISPIDFIPIAQQTSLIIELGKQALCFAADLLRRWSKDPAFAELTVNVNISPLHLGVDLAGDISRVYPEMDHRLGLEFVETDLVSSAIDVNKNLRILSESNIRLIIDDFGVGYSSLSYLWSLPIDELKIDRSFIEHIESDSVRQKLIAAIVSMTEALNISCVAEGIETNAAASVLNRHGVQKLQGFGIARPQPTAEVEHTLRRLMSQLHGHKTMNRQLKIRQWPVNTRSDLQSVRPSGINTFEPSTEAYEPSSEEAA